jgi:NADH-quinone oxidoreductase subunit D
MSSVDSSPAPVRRVTVGIGDGAAGFVRDPGYERGGGVDLATEDMVLNIGPQHPATHGVLRLKLTLDGERIVHCEPVIGYMHRGAEKLFEVRDYRQIIVLSNRHDWLSAFSNELGVVIAVERMLGMEVPERAVWLRTLLAELNRVLNHLMFLGSYPLEVGRDHADLLRVPGARDHPAGHGGAVRRTHALHVQPRRGPQGGHAGRLAGGRTSAAVAAVRSRLPQIEDLVLGNEIFRARTVGVGVLSPELVHAYGVSGPIARASGVDFDLRRDDPYLAYEELLADGTMRVLTRSTGDCYARFELLMAQAKGVAGHRGRVHRAAASAAAGTDQRTAAQDPQGARGVDVRVDREPAGHQRLLPRLPRATRRPGG